MEKKQKSNSIRHRVAIAFIIFVIMQYSLFFGVIYMSGAISRIYDQSYNTFNFQVISRSKMIQEMLNNTRSGFIPTAKQISSEINFYTDRINTDTLGTVVVTDHILFIATEFLVDYLNGSKDVTGAFIILKSDDEKKPCVYIRDNSDIRSIRNANSKVYVRGPAWIAKQYRYHLHYLWQPVFDFTHVRNQEVMDFFDKPLEAAQIKNISYEDTYYWSRPFNISENEKKAITFTIPLIDSKGEAFGICGFELSGEYLKFNMPYRELGNEQSVYILGDRELAIDTSDMVYNGSYFNQLFSNESATIKKINSAYDMHRVTNRTTNLSSYLLVRDEVNIYNNTSMFADETWCFFGLRQESDITNDSDILINTILITQLIVLSISIVYIIVILGTLSKPIERLSMIVSKIDPEESVKLPKTNITEIDNLTNAVELLSREVAISASRLSTIIEMVGISVGGYEERINDGRVYITESLAKMFNIPGTPKRLDYREWGVILNRIRLKGVEGYNDVYVINGKNDEKRWFRIKEIDDNTRTIGFVMDVTDEIMEMQRIEYERDHDSLTKLYNRRAFIETVRDKLKNNPENIGALILMDLDNLKYINESYGHACGDSYIIMMADSLKEFAEHGAIISRMAGDEFTVFMLGSDRQTMKSVILNLINNAKRKFLQLPNGDEQKLRFSAGIAWYPFDSIDVVELIKYADFAMFEAKHNIKGTVEEFDIKLYSGKAFLRDKLESLDKLIEGNFINFVFQPIIDLGTGEVFGYEALLRSEMDGLRNPYEILSLAKSQSKLYYIENLCMNKLGDFISKNIHLFNGKDIFFNSVSSIRIKKEDMDEIIRKYSSIFKHLTIEMTESEEVPYSFLIDKVNALKGLGFKIAIDDYGSGYNSEIILTDILPDYVKIDMSLIREIHIDENKRLLVGNIISFCKTRGIKVIAEGIEVYDELYCVSKMGADYSQGFYTGKPGYSVPDVEDAIKKQILQMKIESNVL